MEDHYQEVTPDVAFENNMISDELVQDSKCAHYVQKNASIFQL
jgi:hypothetical protein